MRFDCGETHEERRKRLTQWHRWFAWFPVKVGDHDCRWFEFVERRFSYDEGEFYWAEYRSAPRGKTE